MVLDPATTDPFGLSYLPEMLCLPPWDTEERDWVEWASERAIGLSVTDEVGLIGLRSIAASLFISDTDFWMEAGPTGSRSQHRYRLGSSPAVTSLVFSFSTQRRLWLVPAGSLSSGLFPFGFVLVPAHCHALRVTRYWGSLVSYALWLARCRNTYVSPWLCPHLIPGHGATRRSALSCCPLGSHRSPATGWEAAALACVGLYVLEVPPGSDCWAQRGKGV